MHCALEAYKPVRVGSFGVVWSGDPAFDCAAKYKWPAEKQAILRDGVDFPQFRDKSKTQTVQQVVHLTLVSHHIAFVFRIDLRAI